MFSIYYYSPLLFAISGSFFSFFRFGIFLTAIDWVRRALKENLFTHTAIIYLNTLAPTVLNNIAYPEKPQVNQLNLSCVCIATTPFSPPPSEFIYPKIQHRPSYQIIIGSQLQS
jgi:hypothetical protein